MGVWFSTEKPRKTGVFAEVEGAHKGARWLLWEGQVNPCSKRMTLRFANASPRTSVEQGAASSSNGAPASPGILNKEL
jgi:hypothetical protein